MYHLFYTKPFKHQKEAVLRALKKGSIAFLMDPGCGKTKPSIDYIAIRHHMGQCDKVLISAPKTVLGVWEEEIETHLHPKIPREIVRLEGRNRVKLINHYKNHDGLVIFLVSYDSTWRTKQLLKLNLDMAICDESHYIANPTSKRSKFIGKIGKIARWKLILTGTFLPNGVLGAYSQMNFVSNVFPMKWDAFKERFMTWYKPKGKYYKIPRRPKRTKELNRKIEEWSYVVKKDEVLDLPKRQDIVIPVEMPPKGWKTYKQMAKDKVIKFKQGKVRAEIILTELLHFQQITGGFIKVDTGKFDRNDNPIKKEILVHTSKLQALNELVDIHMAYGEKILVFCNFIWEVKQIGAMFEKKKISFATLYGKVKGRDELRRDFQAGKYDVMIIQIATGGVGITLTAANIVVFYSFSHRLDHYLQAKDRVHRPGQERDVIYYHLVVKKTIDEVIMSSYKQKKRLQDMVTTKNWEEFI